MNLRERAERCYYTDLGEPGKSASADIAAIERHLREYAEEAVNAMTAQELYDLAVKICLICLSEAAEKYAATIGRVEVVDNEDAARAITGEGR